MSSIGYKEIFKQRKINSLYYDDNNFTLFKDSESPKIAIRNKIGDSGKLESNQNNNNQKKKNEEEVDEKDEKDKKGGSDISLNVNQEGGVGDENIKHVTVTTFF